VEDSSEQATAIDHCHLVCFCSPDSCDCLLFCH
jgi:hypothetical protein